MLFPQFISNLDNISIIVLLCGLFVTSFALFKNTNANNNNNNNNNTLTKDKKVTDSVLKPPGPENFFFTITALKCLIFSKSGLLDVIILLYNRWVDKNALNPVGFKIGHQQFYLLTDPRQVNKAFRDDKNFTKVKEFTKLMTKVLGFSLVTVSEEKVWKPTRERTKHYFNGVSMTRYNEITADVIDRLTLPKMMEVAKSGEELDVWSEMRKVASVVAFSGFLGDDIGSVEPKLYKALGEIFDYLRQKGISPLYVPLWVPNKSNLQLLENQKMLNNMLRPRIETDKDKPTVFGDMIRAHTNPSDGTIDVTKCVQEIISVMIGASETTIIMMTWACYFVAQDLELQERLYKEITDHVQGRDLKECDLSRLQLLDNLFHETLRLKPPSYFLARLLANDVEFDGYLLKKDAIVFVCQYVSHRLPTLWENPLKFDPDRYNENKVEKTRNLFPFGGGKYFCLGNKFAFQESRMMFAKVLLKFKIHASPGLEKVGESFQLTMRPEGPVLVKLTPRVH